MDPSRISDPLATVGVVSVCRATPQALERLVRTKVRRDVRQACAWDEELSDLKGDAQEIRLMELARFEVSRGISSRKKKKHRRWLECHPPRPHLKHATPPKVCHTPQAT